MITFEEHICNWYLQVWRFDLVIYKPPFNLRVWGFEDGDGERAIQTPFFCLYFNATQPRLTNPEPEFYGWLCACGNWQEDPYHCSFCGNEPAWGCDCSLHDDDFIEDDDYYPSDYPHDHPAFIRDREAHYDEQEPE